MDFSLSPSQQAAKDEAIEFAKRELTVGEVDPVFDRDGNKKVSDESRKTEFFARQPRRDHLQRDERYPAEHHRDGIGVKGIGCRRKNSSEKTRLASIIPQSLSADIRRAIWLWQ